MRKHLGYVLICILPSAAFAQQWGDVILQTPPCCVAGALDGQPAGSFNSLVILNVCTTDKSYCETSGANLQSFASTSYVNGQFASLSSQLVPLSGLGTQVTGINAHLTTLDTQVSSLQTQLYQQAIRANELAVIAGALRDAIPNAGDRYAFRVNLAGAAGQAAGGVSFSANLDESFRASLNYGHGQRQNMFSGGLNFSFN
jgi:hypothetical protein